VKQENKILRILALMTGLIVCPGLGLAAPIDFPENVNGHVNHEAKISGWENTKTSDDTPALVQIGPECSQCKNNDLSMHSVLGKAGSGTGQDGTGLTNGP
jgi:hypothetical protein